ncbi:hypothetical protein AB0G05_19795 [Nonomuraea wenchangensis]
MTNQQPDPPPLTDDCVWLQRLDHAEPTCYQHGLPANEHAQERQ